MPDRKAGQFGHRPKTFQHSATSILSSMGRDKGSRGKMPLSGLQKKLTKKERWLLRTGNMPSKAERSIVLLRARRRGEPDGDEECTEHRSLPYPAGASDASAAPAASAQSAPPPVAETSDRNARLAAAAALGLGVFGVRRVAIVLPLGAPLAGVVAVVLLGCGVRVSKALIVVGLAEGGTEG